MHAVVLMLKRIIIWSSGACWHAVNERYPSTLLNKSVCFTGGIDEKYHHRKDFNCLVVP